MTPHFFVSSDHLDGDIALLDADDTRHLATVLRARSGDTVTVADGAGSVWSGRYEGEAAGHARIALGERRTIERRLPTLTVIHALPKQRKLDDVIQRLVEVGVDHVVPVHSERSQVHLDARKAARAVQRWRAVALAAAKQSQRAFLPRIDDVGAWTSAFPGVSGIVCWEESTVPLRDALDHTTAGDEFVVAIGPEGGLTPAEVAVTGMPHASLGPTILRTETAALVAVSAVSYHLGLMARP